MSIASQLFSAEQAHQIDDYLIHNVTIQQNKFRFYLTGFWGKFLKNTVCTIY